LAVSGEQAAARKHLMTIDTVNNMTPVTVPADLWDPGLDGAVSAWLFGDGDLVRQDDLIAEVMVEKSSYEITAPASGRLHIRIAAEAPFRPGAVIAEIA
jgi:pyruvate/2-oxoglutarate dehydrogenase complex dihydrolipoamide acyltransferase (E2) component